MTGRFYRKFTVGFVTWDRVRAEMNNRLIETAYHEAGHAAAAWATNVGVTEITIVRGNGAAGHIVRKYVYLGEDDPGPDWQDWEDLIYKTGCR